MDKETEALIREVAQDSADKAVRSTLIMLGINPDNPIKSQEEFAALRELVEMIEDPHFQEDLKALRGARETLSVIGKRTIVTMVGLAVTGAVYWLWGLFMGAPPTPGG